MTKRWQQIISCGLALCVALAGAVGLSPALHVWLEHGGHGTRHSHAGWNGHQSIASQEHSHPHHSLANDESERAAAPPSSQIHLLADDSLTLFGLQPQDIYRAIGRWMARVAERFPDIPEQDSPGHTHHSLAQLLLNGGVEGTPLMAPLICAPERFSFYSLLVERSEVAVDWYAPVASRPPPACA